MATKHFWFLQQQNKCFNGNQTISIFFNLTIQVPMENEQFLSYVITNFNFLWQHFLRQNS